MSVKEKIYERFLDGSLAQKDLVQICKILEIPYREKNRLFPILRELCDENKIFAVDGVYGTSEQLGLIQGTVTGNERGFAFLTPKDNARFENDLFIPKKNLHGALHGDTVLAAKLQTYGDEVQVVQIVSRGYSQIVGTFRRDRRAGYLIPDEKNFSSDIYIPLSECSHIKNGVKAVAKITDYPYGKSPGGEIIEVLGDEDDFFAEELSIIRSYELYETFPAHVEKDAERHERRGIKSDDLQGRTDFRNERIVTIDGEDTRDIDDAISLKMENGEYVLGVHIADVSHYVTHRSPLDDEAYKRGTSVYFPDRVLPMLPRALSNGICSLNENEDRLALSCIMRIDEKGNVKGSEIVESVIRSAHKMTYTEVSAILDGDKQTSEKYADVLDMVGLFADLTRILQAKREKKGSVTLEVKETKIFFNKENYEITIPDYDRPFSYQIIEAFMVLANETVAEYMQSIDAPFIYRIHEKPNEEKATAFRAFLTSLGVKNRFNVTDIKPYDYKNVLNAAKDTPYYSVVNRVMLRSMQKARYASENVGHFGLASDCYCHFTSPIRRYPDLCIHRIIKEILHGGYEQAQIRYGDFVERAAAQASAQERKATDAERDVDDLYKTMYMSERIGEKYQAVISGVTSFGIFAELDNTIEGFIPVHTLYGEYEFDKDRFTLIGRTDKFTLGERLEVEVTDVNFERRRTELKLLRKLPTENDV